MESNILIKIGAGSGLLPYGAKPLPEQMIDLSSMKFTKTSFTWSAQDINSQNEFEKCAHKITYISAEGQWVNSWYVTHFLGISHVI